MKDKAKVGVVLVNWDGGDFTISCIESLLAMSYLPWRILVIDNASIDGSPELIKEHYPEITLIKNKYNLGFTGANNIGIRYLLGENVDYIWLLNNDTEVHPHCLENLLKEHEDKPDIAATTGKILYPNRKIIWYGGSIFSYWSLTAHHRGEMKEDNGQYDQAEDVPFISGCCMLVRRGAFEKVGLLDDNFFAYWEDFDWCIRAKSAGLRLRYVPQATLYHKVSASLNKHRGMVTGGSSSPLGIYLVYRNRLLIIRKHSSNPIQFMPAILSYSFSFVYYAFGLIILRRWDKLAALFRGVKDGLIIDIPIVQHCINECMSLDDHK